MMTAELVATGILWLLSWLDLALELAGVRRRCRASRLRSAGGLVMITGVLMIILGQRLSVPWLVLGFLLTLAGGGCVVVSHPRVTKPTPPAGLSDGTSN